MLEILINTSLALATHTSQALTRDELEDEIVLLCERDDTDGFRAIILLNETKNTMDVEDVKGSAVPCTTNGSHCYIAPYPIITNIADDSFRRQCFRDEYAFQETCFVQSEAAPEVEFEWDQYVIGFGPVKSSELFFLGGDLMGAILDGLPLERCQFSYPYLREWRGDRLQVPANP